MNLKNYVDLRKINGVSGLFCANGSFGRIEGNVEYTCTEKDNVIVYEYQNEKVSLRAEFTQEKNGVTIRRDYLKNISNEIVELNGFVSRFCMDGNAYEVYTQFNGWQHESTGGWQKLVTQVTTASQGIRTCDSATPMLGLHNLYTGKNTVFHLLPNCQWKMTARKAPVYSKYEAVVVETGIEDDGLHMKVAVGEEISLPAVIFYQAENKTDLDAYKLHEVYNRLYPRKRMPILYNSWLYCFDKLDVDELLKQVDCASELGIEMFMIDAGWFGVGGDWGSSVGDWEENLTGGPKGRLIEISNRVREKGMTFGLWFEPERAGARSKIINEHPEYYIYDCLFDFANEEARNYMLDCICKQIDKYNIGYIKFDFNDTVPHDETGNAFYRYLQGQRTFIEQLKARYPDVHITNCASGGYRMELGQGTFFDSFWLSDNQGPYEGLTIVKNTLKRMPTGLIERWNVQKYCEGFLRYGYEEKQGVMFNCNNGTWDFILNVSDSYNEACLSGGPFGFSCDLVAYPEKYKESWKSFIQKQKEYREFYMNATARILVDSDPITVIQYADPALNRCIIQVFTKLVYATDLIIYPVVEETVTYSYNGEKIGGKELKENGIRVNGLTNNDCKTIELVRI